MRTIVIGVGNELRGDDAVGLEVIRELKARELPGEIDLVAVGDELFLIPDLMMNYQRVVIVDALPPGFRPGRLEVFNFTGEYLPRQETFSLHDLDLGWQLHYALRNGFTGVIQIIGIETSGIELGFGLALILRNGLPLLVEEVKKVIAKA